MYYQAILTSNNNMQMRILSTDTYELNGFEVKEITSASAVTYLFCQLLKNGKADKGQIADPGIWLEN